MSERDLIEKTKQLSSDDLEKVLELWFKAAQGNKDETSGLHAELRRMIKELDTKVDNYIKRSEPVVQTFENLNWVKKALVWIAVAVSAIVGISTGIPKIIHDILGR